MGKQKPADFTDLIGRVVKDAAKLTGGLAALATYGAGKLLYEGGKLAVNGIEKVHKTYNQDKKLLKEIEDIEKFCSKTINELNDKQEQCQKAFATEHEERLKIIETVNEQFKTLEILQHFYFSQDNTNEHYIEAQNIIGLAEKVAEGGLSIDSSALLTSGLGAGLGVGAGAVGLMTAFGSAGTGAALSSLTGTAYIHATLAALGGGTLASGGFGMVGGAMVLGAAVLGPAVAIGAIIADDQIKNNHQKALKRRHEAEQLKKESKLLFNKLDEGIKNFRAINYNLHGASEFFQELINISLAAPILHFKDEYYKVLQETAAILLLYGNLSIVDEQKKVNEKINEQLSFVKEEFSKCREHYYEYRVKLSPQYQTILDKLKNNKLKSIQNQEIPRTFYEALDIAQFEIDITAMRLNFKVVDPQLVLRFRTLLKNGVVIKILYGIGDINDIKNLQTNDVIEKLKMEFKDFPNFKVKHTNTHVKVFICDDKFFVSSSFNVLSNYNFKENKTNAWDEDGLMSNNKELIDEYRNRYFNF